MWATNGCAAYSGINISTTTVPEQCDLDLVAKFISNGLNVKTTAIVPCSRSFLKILDVPYPVTKDDITNALHAASEPPIRLTAQLHIMHNSHHSDTATVWFNVWDSQSRANIKKLNGLFVTIGSAQCIIRPAWGHPTNSCKAEAIYCPHCSGPHSEKNHQEYTGCCKGNPKANLPILPTIVDVECPHIPICSNCHGKHAANDHKCKYWYHRFDADWFSRQRAEK
ncbi:hypothetical protein AN958_07132 [Leucoagaricus sp. SymC.cos]|nr:hypothetical protein AN958_07132 [Leucoagaricus sp. SymC.cos]